MNNITAISKDIYVPKKAIVMYETLVESEQPVYIESFDMDEYGRPINARPLTAEEADDLGRHLQSRQQSQNSFLQSESLLPENILFIDTSTADAGAIWYTKPKKVRLLFKKQLGIPSGTAYIPALLWKATKSDLELFALVENKKPTLKTKLYHAPFFNIYENGSVCMGTVDISIGQRHTLNEFMKAWEGYFFNSYFSHTLTHIATVKTNLVQLWKEQIASSRRFPVSVLKQHSVTLKKLLP